MRIGIIGLGLIGGSLAGALRAAGHDTVGCDRDPRAEIVALEREYLGSVESLATVASTSEVVVLCLPINATIDALGSVASQMSDGAILTDVASVKRSVVNAMHSIQVDIRCIGGHPMAGKATHGGESADPKLFHHKPFAIVSTDSSDGASIGTMRSLSEDIGAIPVEISAEHHDAVVARTSHLPQIISSALSLALIGGRDGELTGTGLASMLRLAGSPEDMWAEILTHNGDNVAIATRDFSDQLDGLLAAISTSDAQSIRSIMKAAREAAA